MSSFCGQFDLVIGIDISKTYFDAAYGSQGQVLRFDRTSRGFHKLIKLAQKMAACPLVVLEATGSLHSPLLAFLHGAGIAVSVVNPRQIRDFAKATGQLSKTDKIDACIVSLFGERIDLRLTEPQSADGQKLQALVRRRGDLIEMKVMEKNRLSSSEQRELDRQIGKHIRWLEREITKLDEQIDKLIAENEMMSRKREILESMPGVSRVTSALLIAELPELGRLNRKQIAKLVGVAPLEDQSGKYQGRAHTWGGRTRVRTGLYLPALTARRYNEDLKEFYERLEGSGKKKIVAVVAVMRKMLTMLNSMVRDDRLFNQNYA